ncbi:MAG: hypothetical protein ACT4OX_05200 [Actinomycetota bacterium]
MVQDLRPRSVGEILDVAVSLYRARFPALMLVTLFVEIPVQILSMLVLLSALPDDFEVGYTGQIQPVYDGSDVAVGLAATLFVLFLSVVSTGFVTAVATRIVADAYVGAADAGGDAARIAGRRILAVLGVTTLSTLGIAVGILACIAPGIWLMGAWSVVVPVLILENTGVLRALGRSFELTKTRIWAALGVVITGQLMTTTITLSLTTAIDLLISTGDSLTAQVIAQSVAATIAAIITTPFIATAVVALYFDLRIRNEAFDVQMLLSRLDSGRA